MTDAGLYVAPGADEAASDGRKAGYIRLAAIGALLLLVCVIYAESIATIVGIWNTYEFQHGYLIPVIFGYLLWHRREALGRTSVQPAWTGVLLVVLAVWIWLLARQTLIQTVEHAAVLAIFHALVIAVLGWRIYWNSAFALIYLALAVPAGIDLVPWLMEVTANLSHAGLRLLGVPVLREGMFFILPGGTFEVAEACSGYRFLFSGIALSTLIAYLDIRSWSWRIGFIIFAVLCMVLLNSVRATLVMAIASATDMRYLADDHIWFGWVLFAITMVALYALVQRFSHAR